MRLWQKISVICILVLLVVLLLTNALTLGSVRNAILELTVTNAKEKQASLAKSFANMVNLTLDETMDQPARDEAILNCFSTYADETGVLVRNFDTLYSFVSMQPQDILLLSTSDQRVFLDEVGMRNYLIVGSLVALTSQNTPYAVYVVRDITPVYRSFDAMVVRFVIISLACMLMGVAAIILLVHAATRPLKLLGQSARHIADGDYGERAAVSSRDEIGALAQDFNRMAEAVQSHVAALEERNTRQELFIGGLTHEFKTPMTSMMLHSETLLNNPRLTPEQRETSLMHIHTQCAWLECLTQKLMSLVTLAQNLQPRQCSVSQLFERVAESTAETMTLRNTPLVTQCDVPTLPMDIDLMQSLLINLVDNASKASEPGQTILLCAEGRAIYVQDHGRGIPHDALDRVTEPFYMVDKSRSKRQGGSGLGLALVKRIADAHHAELVMESAPGLGTTVSILFPE